MRSWLQNELQDCSGDRGGRLYWQALVRVLLNRGVSVAALGRDPSIFPPNVNPIRTKSFGSPDLEAALTDQKYDVLFHLAAYGVRPNDRDVDTMQAVNVAATGALVRAAAQSSTRAVVYAGSCSEYQPGEQGRLIDEGWELAKNGLYGTSKIAGGFWGRAIAAEAGIALAGSGSLVFMGRVRRRID